jgi:hypothetical protein
MDSKRLNDTMKSTADYYKQKEDYEIRDKPSINKSSIIIAQKTNYLPIYHPQRLDRIISSKMKWKEEQEEEKKRIEKENEEREIREMTQYLPKGKLNLDEYVSAVKNIGLKKNMKKRLKNI